MQKRAKIICTIGPSSLKPLILNGLKERGVDFFRINLSHTPTEKIEEIVLELKKYGVPIIIDTEGPQVRTGNSYEISLREGQIIKLHNKEVACDENNFFLTPLKIIEKLQLGDLISADFNSALLSVFDVSPLKKEGYILCRVLLPGNVGGRKAIHIDPFEEKIVLPVFSDKDIIAIDIAKKHNINFFTLSFIKEKSDLVLFKHMHPSATFYAKIETGMAVENLNEIIEFANGILIDRGDLSRDVPIEKIPFFQKYIISKAREMGKEAFVATNTLEKMAYSLKPDKSEANDIINIFLDGATGVALTKETAVGNYPLETVNMLKTIINQIEKLDLNGDFSKQEILKKIIEKNYLKDMTSSLLTSPHGGKLVNRIIKNKPSKEEIESAKKIFVDENIIMDAEQIAIGSFSPLEGFMTEAELNSVLNNLKLPTGVVWPLPIVFQINEKDLTNINKGERIFLVGKKDGEAYSSMVVEDIYKPNKKEIVMKWFGTDSLLHPGVKSIFDGGEIFLGGNIGLVKRKESEHKMYELTPLQTRRIFSEKGWSKIVGFHTRNVIHRSHEFIQLEAMKKGACDGLFVHPVTGKKKPGDFQSNIIIKSYEKMVNEFYPKNKVVFSVFSTFSRYAGPREALFTALVRKNFGCSHFIVGRDHTGVSNFYGPKESHEIFDRFTKEELGIIPVKFDKVFYSDLEKKHLHEPQNLSHPENKKMHVSGTEAREMLKKGLVPPEWFMRPEISQLIRNSIKNGEEVFVDKDKSAKILWFTGLSGSGKTTIANLLKEHLEKKGKKIKIFDGDIVRKEINPNLGFTKEDIEKNNRIIISLCNEEKENYDYILVPVISPIKKVREDAKNIFGDSFLEIFFKCSYEECKKRDVKGLYRKAENGEIENFVGLHVRYEPPEKPDLEIDNSKESVEISMSKIISHLNKN